MITIAMRTAIAAKPERVWRALTDPSEVLAWDDNILGAIGSTEGYPTAGHAVRWRYRLGCVQLILHDRPQEVVPFQRLHRSLSLSSLRYDETFSLAAEARESGSPVVTQLAIKVTASNSVPVLDATVDRFEVRRRAVERTGEVMRSLQRWCEADLKE